MKLLNGTFTKSCVPVLLVATGTVHNCWMLSFPELKVGINTIPTDQVVRRLYGKDFVSDKPVIYQEFHFSDIIFLDDDPWNFQNMEYQRQYLLKPSPSTAYCKMIEYKGIKQWPWYT